MTTLVQNITIGADTVQPRASYVALPLCAEWLPTSAGSKPSKTSSHLRQKQYTMGWVPIALAWPFTIVHQHIEHPDNITNTCKRHIFGESGFTYTGQGLNSSSVWLPFGCKILFEMRFD